MDSSIIIGLNERFFVYKGKLLLVFMCSIQQREILFYKVEFFCKGCMEYLYIRGWTEYLSLSYYNSDKSRTI